MIKLFLWSLACAPDANPYRNTALVADLTDTTALIGFSDAPEFASSAVVRVLSDGAFADPLPPHVVPWRLFASGDIAYARLTGDDGLYTDLNDGAFGGGRVWVPDADGTPDEDGNLPGTWCAEVSFDLVRGPVDVRCLTVAEGTHEYAAGANVSFMSELATAEPGLAWGVQPLATSGYEEPADGEIWAFRGDDAIRWEQGTVSSAQPLAFVGGYASFVEDNFDSRIEVFRLVGDTIERTVLDYCRPVGDADLRDPKRRGRPFGNYLMVQGCAAPFLGATGLVATSDVLSGDVRCFTAGDGTDLGSTDLATDGRVVYSRFQDGDGANFCACPVDAPCAVVDAAARPRFEAAFEGFAGAAWAGDGTMLVDYGGVYLVHGGRITADLTDVLIVVDTYPTYDGLFVAGAHADLGEGVFRPVFEGDAVSFEGVDTFGLRIEERVTLP